MNLETNGRDANRRHELALDSDEVDNGIVEASDSGTTANTRSSDSSCEEEDRADKGVDGSLDSIDLSLESSPQRRSQICNGDGDSGADVLKNCDNDENRGSEGRDLLVGETNGLASNTTSSSCCDADNSGCGSGQALGDGLVIGLDKGLSFYNDLSTDVVLNQEDIVVYKIVSKNKFEVLGEVTYRSR